MADNKTFICPVCLCSYSELLKKEGDKCEDLSNDQTMPCVGRVIPDYDFFTAEWVVGDGHWTAQYRIRLREPKNVVR